MIFSFFYNLFIGFLSLTMLPKWIKRSKSREGKSFFWHKLGFVHFPQFEHKKVVWIHAVSLGETKAIEPIIKLIKQGYKDISIVCSHASIAGLQHSMKNNEVEFSFLLPIDLSWIMRSIVKKINPLTLLLVESDFWPHMLQEVKKTQASIYLVNGKISERSYQRIKRFYFSSKYLFYPIDYLFVQNERYAQLFANLGISPDRIMAPGNTKFDIQRAKLATNELRNLKNSLFVKPSDFVIVFGCTHPGEEELAIELFATLKKRGGAIKLFIAPRHLERIEAIQKVIAKRNKYSLFTEISNQDIVLVNQMGQLDKLYQIATVSILGGSFFAGVGGHNLFEPLEGNGVLFYGPFIYNQQQMDALIQEYQAGVKTTKTHLSQYVSALLDDEPQQQMYKGNALALTESFRGASKEIYKKIKKALV